MVPLLGAEVILGSLFRKKHASDGSTTPEIGATLKALLATRGSRYRRQQAPDRGLWRL